MSELHVTLSSSFNTTNTWSSLAESRRRSLRIVLDYAYQGIGHGVRGGTCHLAEYREDGCALCDSLAEVERMALAEAPTENWWSESLTLRVARRLYRWLRWRRGWSA